MQRFPRLRLTSSIFTVIQACVCLFRNTNFQDILKCPNCREFPRSQAFKCLLLTSWDFEDLFLRSDETSWGDGPSRKSVSNFPKVETGMDLFLFPDSLRESSANRLPLPLLTTMKGKKTSDSLHSVRKYSGKWDQVVFLKGQKFEPKWRWNVNISCVINLILLSETGNSWTLLFSIFF